MIVEKSAIPYRPAKAGTIYTSQLPEQAYKPLPENANTLSKQFLLRVKALGDAVAMRKKNYGIWQQYTWNEVYTHVSDFCLGLVSLGLQADETVAIIGENDPEFYWAQVATHAARSRTVGVFSDASPPELHFVLETTGATFLLAHDQEQVDKALDLKDKASKIRKVIYWDERGLWAYDDDWLISFADVEALGRDYRQSNPDMFEKMVAATQPDDIILLSMTSGTTSAPKFAMITQYQYILGNQIFFDYMRSYQTDNWLSFSPMAWASEQAFGFAPHLIHGHVVNFPEGPETIQTDIREIAPAGLLFPSRLWENLASIMQVRIHDSSWINRFLYKLFMPIAYKVIDLEDERNAIPPHIKALRWLGEHAVFQPLRDKVGLTHARNVLTAGAALSPDVIRFFRALGVELRQLYASTETFGTLHIPGKVKLASVGVILPGVELKIAEDQEILIRTKARFAGYFNDPEKTGEALDEEGWYHTGDAGYVDDDGHLIYLDRVKDMIELANGETFSPQYIEGRLKFSPNIQDVMALGGFDMAYVTAIIIIDFETMARWAEKNRVNFTTFVDLSQKPEVAALIKEDIQRVNETLPPPARIQKFVILHKAFDADEAELTRTRKLRRRTLQQKYGDILEAMYGDKERIVVSAEVKYRDGRSGVIETELNVNSV